MIQVQLITMNITILDETAELDERYKSELEQILISLFKIQSIPKDSEICLTFIEDKEMRKLNKQWRNIDRTTDVLSFPQHDESGEHILGDLVISLETARRHAQRFGITLHDEIKWLIVHGVLHLLGHDHKRKKETEIMRNKEKELLKLLSSM